MSLQQMRIICGASAVERAVIVICVKNPVQKMQLAELPKMGYLNTRQMKKNVLGAVFVLAYARAVFGR